MLEELKCTNCGHKGLGRVGVEDGAVRYKCPDCESVYLRGLPAQPRPPIMPPPMTNEPYVAPHDPYKRAVWGDTTAGSGPFNFDAIITTNASDYGFVYDEYNPPARWSNYA